MRHLPPPLPTPYSLPLPPPLPLPTSPLTPPFLPPPSGAPNYKRKIKTWLICLNFSAQYLTKRKKYTRCESKCLVFARSPKKQTTKCLPGNISPGPGHISPARTKQAFCCLLFRRPSQNQEFRFTPCALLSLCYRAEKFSGRSAKSLFFVYSLVPGGGGGKGGVRGEVPSLIPPRAPASKHTYKQPHKINISPTPGPCPGG